MTSICDISFNFFNFEFQTIKQSTRKKNTNEKSYESIDADDDKENEDVHMVKTEQNSIDQLKLIDLKANSIDQSEDCILVENDISLISIDDSVVEKMPRSQYSFEMLLTDDSTDEEDDVLNRPDKRPPPPAWSLFENRSEKINLQSIIPLNTIDKFFGQSAEVDLLEIFPRINMQLVQRRESSFYWSTPPSYSTMPKY